MGNPPYIGIEDIASDLKSFYGDIFTTAVKRFDLYSLFIEKVSHIIRDKALFALIIPGKFLNNKQFIIARQIVCNDGGVIVVKIDEKIFEEAQVNSVIIIRYQSTKANYKSLQIEGQNLVLLSDIDLKNITSDKELIFRLEINATYEKLITKVEKDSFKVIDIGEVKDGVISGLLKDVLFKKEGNQNSDKRLYFGKQLSKYHLGETNIWIDYRSEFMIKEEIKRKEGGAPGLRMRKKEIFEREKILTRFVAKEIIATYDNKSRYYEHTLHGTHISDKRFKVKYVLGLFNSSLF